MITDCVCGGSVNGSSSSNSNCASFVGVAENCTVYATRCLSTTSYTNVNKWNSLSHCADHAYRAVNVFYYVNANDAANVGEQVTTSQLADGTITTALQAGRATTVWTQYAAISQPMLRLFALNQANDGYYLIDSEQDWRNFAALIQTTPTANARMTADISVTTMVGSSDKPFSGIFNGDYHTLTVNISGSGEKTAPFCYVKEENGVTAVIRRLKVTGSISTADKFAGGIVGYSEGQVNIIGCGCSVTIHSTVNGDGSHGGLVGYSSGALYIEGCTFTGKMLTTAGTYKCGGFIGWNGGATARMSSSLYAPAAIEGSETEVLNGPDGTISATFSRNGGTILNCYYTRTLGTAQGTQVYSITAGSDVTISGLSNASNTYPASGLTFYNPGLKCGDAYYARNGDAVGLSLSHGNKSGNTFNQYSVTGGGSLANPTTNTPTLTMADADQTINALWTENAATLSQTTDNSSFISANNGLVYDITLGRTMNAGGWNTFCVPFEISSSQIESVFGSGTEVRELGSSDFDEGTKALTLNFTEATSIQAGKPYLVYLGSGSNVVNPTFEDVTIVSGTTTKTTDYANFMPVMNPTSLTGGDKSILFVTGGNKLTYPSSTGNINGFRAYFQLHDLPTEARSFAMCFEEGNNTTGVIGVKEVLTPEGMSVARENDNSWYTLDGRKIANGQKPNAKGIYIVNGKKTIIK